MADQTDLTLPLTPAKIGRAVGVIVERAFPSPRQENCIAVGEMERELTALCGEAVQLAYNDAAGIARDARERLARHLYVTSASGDWQARAAQGWDERDERISRDRWLGRADALLAVITGKEN